MMNTLMTDASPHTPPADDADFARRYLDALSKVVGRIDADAVASAIALLRAARAAGRTIYVCGNGGSASIASEFVCDMVKGASFERPSRFRVMGLTDSLATITAYANDVSYEAVFVEQLKNFAQEGDVLIAISGSGNSANVLRAVEWANENGLSTVGLTTGRGGQLRDAAGLCLGVDDDHMGRLEDGFYALTHVLAYAFIDRPDAD